MFAWCLWGGGYEDSRSERCECVGDSRLSFESVGGEWGIGLGITIYVGGWLSLLGIVVGNIMLIGGGLWDIFLSKALFFLAE